MLKRPDSCTVLAIHAHPDDVEFQCAGTLALLRNIDCRITIATMTPGDCGSAELAPERIAEVRRLEAQRSAELLGAEYVCLEFRDLSIDVDNDSRRRVTELVRRVRPHLVLTAPPIDYLTDHEVTSRLVRDACFAASAPNYATHQPRAARPTEKIPHLYYVDPVEGTDHFGQPLQPHFYIDITQTFDLKRRMLACHESQRAWLQRQHGMDEYLRQMEDWSRRRGAEIGASYAEAFRQHLGHPYPQDNLLLALVGQDGRGRKAEGKRPK